MNYNKLFEMINDIQKKRPDWRFSLLGGDTPRQYRRSKTGKILGYAKTRSPFGWQAEFFGLKDQSRLQSGFYRSPDDAILIACGLATKAIRQKIK